MFVSSLWTINHRTNNHISFACLLTWCEYYTLKFADHQWWFGRLLGVRDSWFCDCSSLAEDRRRLWGDFDSCCHRHHSMTYCRSRPHLIEMLHPLDHEQQLQSDYWLIEGLIKYFYCTAVSINAVVESNGESIESINQSMTHASTIAESLISAISIPTAESHWSIKQGLMHLFAN